MRLIKPSLPGSNLTKTVLIIAAVLLLSVMADPAASNTHCEPVQQTQQPATQPSSNGPLGETARKLIGQSTETPEDRQQDRQNEGGIRGRKLCGIHKHYEECQ